MLLAQSQSASHSSLLADETLLTNVMCGVLSGVISSSIANPTDVLKVAFWGLCWTSLLLFEWNGRLLFLESSRAGLTVSWNWSTVLKNKALSFHFFIHIYSCTYKAALSETVLNMTFLRSVTSLGSRCGLLIACLVEWRAHQCHQDPICGLFIEGNL